MAKRHYATLVLEIKHDGYGYVPAEVKVTSSNLNQIDWDSMFDVMDGDEKLELCNDFMSALHKYKEWPTIHRETA